MKRKTMARKPVGRKQQQNASNAQKKKATLGDDAFDWSGAGGAAALDVIASDSEDDDDEGDDSDAGGKASKKRSRDDKRDGGDDDSDEEENESAQDKRIRLAKEYLTKITAQEADGDDDTSGVDERVGARLQQDALEAMGKLFKEVAAQFEDFEFGPESTRFLRGHKVCVDWTGLDGWRMEAVYLTL
ncbi:hypothetical protein PINS_up013468 [Pythium insidiosum]|nr:hypothetical protein PINS_up013468 [Pythium insidiosum]